MTAHLKEDEAELVARLKHLVSLNEPRHGAPYMGTAAQSCVVAMDEAAAAIVRIAEEREEAREALKVMHRRAQSAEGQAEAARYDLNMWSGHPVMKTVGGYLASEVAKSGLKALNRRALSQQPDKEGTP